MTTVYEIPLSAEPQTFGITLAGVTYQLTLIYRDAPEGGWVVDIDDANGNALVHGIPLVTGADLLAQYSYLGFQGGLIAQSDGTLTDVPTFDNLGTSSHVYFVTPASTPVPRTIALLTPGLSPFTIGVSTIGGPDAIPS